MRNDGKRHVNCYDECDVLMRINSRFLIRKAHLHMFVWLTSQIWSTSSSTSCISMCLSCTISLQRRKRGISDPMPRGNAASTGLWWAPSISVTKTANTDFPSRCVLEYQNSYFISGISHRKNFFLHWMEPLKLLCTQSKIVFYQNF